MGSVAVDENQRIVVCGESFLVVRCYAITSVTAKYYSYFVCVETFKIYHAFGRLENIFLVSCLCFK